MISEVVFKIKEIQDKNSWESFLLGCEEKTFLSSWNWGEFNKRIGNKIWRLGFFEGDSLIATALVIKIIAKRGSFFLVPHGPNIKLKIKNQKLKILKLLLKELQERGEKEKVDFIRIAPIWERNKENEEIFKNLHFKNAPIHVHPELTWELDITPSEEEILKKMRKTTRYLIRQAQNNPEIKVYQSQNLADIEIFNGLYSKLAKRANFIPFPLDYLKNEFSVFLADKEISIFLAKYQNEVLAGGIFVFWQGIGFYHHGASLKKYSKIPLSYLLLWEAIREAKKRNCRKFNFWGIAPCFSSAKEGIPKFAIQNSKFLKHPWAGLTIFKMGFGGYKKEYVKTQDFPLSKKYWLTFLLEKIRKIKRGF